MALRRRNLVVLSRGSVRWRGRGEYGRLTRHRGERDDRPVTDVVREGERWPYSRWSYASRDVDFTRAGMPTPGLWVWERQSYEGFMAALDEGIRAVAAHERDAR